MTAWILLAAGTLVFLLAEFFGKNAKKMKFSFFSLLGYSFAIAALFSIAYVPTKTEAQAHNYELTIGRKSKTNREAIIPLQLNEVQADSIYKIVFGNRTNARNYTAGIVVLQLKKIEK